MYVIETIDWVSWLVASLGIRTSLRLALSRKDYLNDDGHCGNSHISVFPDARNNAMAIKVTHGIDREWPARSMRACSDNSPKSTRGLAPQCLSTWLVRDTGGTGVT